MRSVLLLLAGAILCSQVSVLEGQEKKTVQKNSVYNFEVASIDGKKTDLSKYKGKVLLIVNVASECGYTDHYKGLQALHAKYGKDGLAVLGFPCNDFGSQEPGDEAKIKSFCTKNYGVEFDMFSKVKVKGENAAPLYRYLTSEKTNPKHAGAVQWNFEMFVIARDGSIVGRFASATEPESDEVLEVIRREISKK